jgi:hypothetical protein
MRQTSKTTSLSEPAPPAPGNLPPKPVILRPLRQKCFLSRMDSNGALTPFPSSTLPADTSSPAK